MATYHHTEGICLRRVDYSNTSQVASFLTPDAGRLSVMAKGVTRAPKKGIRTGFDLLGRYEIVYTLRRPGSLQNLTYRWLREDFRGMQRAVERILCGYYAAELALNFTVEGDPCPRLYALMLEGLASFAAGRRLGGTVVALELGALREHGSCPEFGRCVECGGHLPQRGAIAFSARAGGPLCPRCEEGAAAGLAGRVTSVSGGVLRELAALAGAGGALPALPAHRALAISALLRFHMRELLGRELRMWKYLGRRELSRSLRRVRRRAGLR